MKLVCGVVLVVIGVSSSVRAGTFDAALCQRVDMRYVKGDQPEPPHPYMSVVRESNPSSITQPDLDDKRVTVCRDAAKKQCSTSELGLVFELDINAAGTLIVGGGDKGTRVIDAKTHKTKRKLINKRDAEYSCGGGKWMGDVVLATGWDCHEYDALPYLANGKTGAFIAPFVDKKSIGNGETLYDVAHVDGNHWAIAVYDHNNAAADSGGSVFLIDVTTGKVKATAKVLPNGSVQITEGKQSRSLAKLAPCAN